MIKRSVNAGDQEPDQYDNKLPSEDKEHLLQVTDIFDQNYENNKFNLDIDTVLVKYEVVGGEENGRSLLHRLNLNPEWKGFFATRMFLKSIGEEYKGDITIDTDRWQGCQFYATVVHNPNKDKSKVYANIDKYNYDKLVDNSQAKNMGTILNNKTTDEIVGWDDDIK